MATAHGLFCQTIKQSGRGGDEVHINIAGKCRKEPSGGRAAGEGVRIDR